MDGLYICENLPFEITYLSRAAVYHKVYKGFTRLVRLCPSHYALSAIPCATASRTALCSVFGELTAPPGQFRCSPSRQKTSPAPFRGGARQQKIRRWGRSFCPAGPYRPPRTPFLA